MSAKKPIVQLLESYVLSAIGELPAEQLERIAVVMKMAFGADAKGNWQGKLREEFGVTETLDEQLRTIWSQSKKVAAEKSTDLAPGDFASMVVEANFLDAVEMMTAEAEAEAERKDDDD